MNTQITVAVDHHFGNRDLVLANIKQIMLDFRLFKPANQYNKAAAGVSSASELLLRYLISEGEGHSTDELPRIQVMLDGTLPFRAKNADEIYIIGRSRYLHAALSSARAESTLCAFHILQCFASAPRWARAVASDIYDSVFRTECDGAYSLYDSKLSDVRAHRHLGSTVARRGTAIAVGSGIIAAATAGLFLAGRSNSAGLTQVINESIRKTAGPFWRSGARDKIIESRTKVLGEELDAKIDSICVERALEWI